MNHAHMTVITERNLQGCRKLIWHYIGLKKKMKCLDPVVSLFIVL